MLILISYNGAVSSPDKIPNGSCGSYASQITPSEAGPVTLKVDGVVLAPTDSIPKTGKVFEVVSAPAPDDGAPGPLWQAMAAADGAEA
jgi:hypothetical protein